jgi:hypothetical protein
MKCSEIVCRRQSSNKTARIAARRRGIRYQGLHGVAAITSATAAVSFFA